MDNVIDQTYLPFTEAQLNVCLAAASKVGPEQGEDSDDKQPKRVGPGYYTRSATEYRKYRDRPELFRSVSVSKFTRQIEKDERFWTAATLMAFKYSEGPGDYWSKLLTRCFQISHPPVGEFASWRDAIGEDPALFLEAPLPSPKAYSRWLREHLPKRQLIPYILDAVPTNPEAKLEGFTHADAVLVNPNTHFSVVFESKVLSDISYEITFDCLRNQIARILDVILDDPDPNEHLLDALSERRGGLTCFVLLTPDLFKRSPQSRLYGRVMAEYRNDPVALERDLPHRSGIDWKSLAKRIGWLTWEMCNDVLPRACKWLKD